MYKNKIILVFVLGMIMVGCILYIKQNKLETSLMNDFYEDQKGQFIIDLPKDWDIKNKNEVATTSYNIWFYNPKDEKEVGATILVNRQDRVEKMNNLINMLGEDIFLQEMVRVNTKGINKYKIIATSSEIINGKNFYRVRGTYEGMSNKKVVVQELYLTLSNEAYYLISTDIYQDLLPKYENSILGSVKTFKII